MKPVVLLGVLVLAAVLWSPWASAVCNVAGDCSCVYTNSPGTMYYLPNGSNQSVTCALACTDSGDGSCDSMATCRLSIQESFAGAASTLDTGPLEGTATQAAFCGGQSCMSGNLPGGGPTFTRNISVVRTNTTGSGFWIRCNSEHPGAGASSWGSVYVSSPANPNVTGQMWFDAGDVQTNGTNQSERLEGNKTCFNASIVSDTTITNASLWGNMSINGSNSTTFRLLDKNQSAGLANSSVTFCENITNGLSGAASWANYSWALCANSNTTTGAVTRYGMSCKPLRGPTWYTSGTSMSTMNSAGTFNWFNVSWPNAPLDPCVVSGAWTVSTTITCTNVNITVDTLNVTETGSLTLINTTLRSSNIYVTTGALGTGRLSVENTTYDGSQAWWLNGNLTIGGRVNISGVKLYLNGTADGMAGINVTNTGALFIRGNATNITAGETTTFGYYFWVDSGSTFSIQDTALYYSGYSGFRYGRGLTINTTAVNFTRVKIYDSGYVGITILDGANGTNYTATDISRASDATLQLRYVKDLNISQHNSTLSGGGPSLIMDGLIIEHANISGNTGDGIGGNGVQNLTLIDVNMTGGSQSAIGIANIKNLTLISVNITSNAWHGVSGYTMNGVWLHEVNTSGNGQSDVGINYDQLTAKTTSKSNYVHTYNSTVSGTIKFTGSVNLTAWNTTTATITYGTCTICNLTVVWPIALAFINGTGDAVADAVVNLYSRDQTFPNHSNKTGTGGFVRYVNRTEYSRWAATSYAWAGNDTLNASKHYYANYSQSLNWTGPNATTLTLTYTQCNPVPGTAWNITQNITCANTSISAYSTNITSTGSLHAYQVNLSTGNYSIEAPTDINQVNLYRNSNFTLSGNFSVNGIYIFSNVTILLNTSSYLKAGFNLTRNGDLRLLNGTRVLSPNKQSQRGWLLAYPGSNLTLLDTYLEGLGGGAVFREFGIEINTSGANISRINTSYVQTLRFYQGAHHLDVRHIQMNDTNLTGLGFFGSNNINISDVNLSGCGTICSLVNLQSNASDILINETILTNSRSTENLDGVIESSASTNLTIDNTTLINNDGRALLLGSDKDVSLSNLIIRNNSCQGTATSNDFSITLETNLTARNIKFIENAGAEFWHLNIQNSDAVTFIDSEINNTITPAGCVAIPSEATQLFMGGAVKGTRLKLLNVTMNFSNVTILGGPNNNMTVQWPVSIYVNDSHTNASVDNARVHWYSTVATVNATNGTNATGTAGYVRHLNLTDFIRWSRTSTIQYNNYTLNVSKAGYDNASVSLNVSGPNETYVALSPQCVPPNQTHRTWRIDLSDNCDVRHRRVDLGRGNLTFYSETEGEGNATFTDVNLTAMRRIKEPSALRSRHNITVQEGKGQRTWTFQTA